MYIYDGDHLTLPRQAPAMCSRSSRSGEATKPSMATAGAPAAKAVREKHFAAAPPAPWSSRKIARHNARGGANIRPFGAWRAEPNLAAALLLGGDTLSFHEFWRIRQVRKPMGCSRSTIRLQIPPPPSRSPTPDRPPTTSLCASTRSGPRSYLAAVGRNRTTTDQIRSSSVAFALEWARFAQH